MNCLNADYIRGTKVANTFYKLPEYVCLLLYKIAIYIYIYIIYTYTNWTFSHELARIV